jgi:hypothetical protein
MPILFRSSSGIVFIAFEILSIISRTVYSLSVSTFIILAATSSNWAGSLQVPSCAVCNFYARLPVASEVQPGLGLVYNESSAITIEIASLGFRAPHSKRRFQRASVRQKVLKGKKVVGPDCDWFPQTCALVVRHIIIHTNRFSYINSYHSVVDTFRGTLTLTLELYTLCI